LFFTMSPIDFSGEFRASNKKSNAQILECPMSIAVGRVEAVCVLDDQVGGPCARHRS
jgi:hypothetical protein